MEWEKNVETSSLATAFAFTNIPVYADKFVVPLKKKMRSKKWHNSISNVCALGTQIEYFAKSR